MVHPQALMELLESSDAARIVIVDVSPCRPGVPHVPGALPFDLHGPMSDQSTGLPHTMPSVPQFQARLRELGVNNDSHVIVTEDDFLFASARPWWMMHACGFDNVSILEGGNAGWVVAGGHLTTDITPTLEPGNVTLTAIPGAIVDARSAERFAGKVAEPRVGLRAGHIPTATNLPYTQVIDDGRIRPVEELQQLVNDAAGDRPIVATCGSGVTACVIALAATLAGRKDVGIYDGSWSEWARPGDTPVVTEERVTATVASGTTRHLIRLESVIAPPNPHINSIAQYPVLSAG